jgi:uncharacterized membrane protein (DUF106 family)
MESYDKLKTEMKAIQQKIIEVSKNQLANKLRKLKLLCKKFGFATRMLKVG